MLQQNTGNNDILIGTIDADILKGNAGNDILLGLGNDDLLFGNADDDLIFGNQGNDTLRGGKGNDLLQGGADDDQVYGDLGNDTVNGELGNDTLFGGCSDSSNNDNKGNDVLIGGAGDDLIFGNGGEDQLFGNTGSDTLAGGKGNDTLNGGVDNDILSGDIGDDRLIGDIGADTVTGASGNDTFVIGLRNDIPGILSTGGAEIKDADHITDFVKGADKIEFIGGLTFEQLKIFSGTGEYAGFSIIQETVFGQYLAILRGVEAATIERSDFVGLAPYSSDGTSLPPVLTPTPTPTPTPDPTPANNAPTIGTKITSQTATENSAFQFQIPANSFSDSDGDTLSYSIQLSNGNNVPSWLKFDAATKTFSGTPTATDIGTLSLTVITSDGKGGTANQNFDIVVAAASPEAPFVETPISDKNDVLASTVFNYSISATTFKDPQNDNLTYTATLADGTPLPTWLTFNATNLTFSGTPTNANAGVIGIKVTATNNSGNAISDEFNITVNPVNNPPVAGTISSQNATQDTAFNFALPADTFTDIDAGDNLTYTATLADGSALPSWLQFNAGTQTFTGIPTNTDVGNITVKVTAKDQANAEVSTNFDLAIANVNGVPVANDDTISNATVLLRTNLEIPVTTLLVNDTDVDGDTLTVTDVSSSTNSSVSLINGVVKFNPTPTGSASFTYTISDGNGGTASATVNLTSVTSVNSVNLSDIVAGTNLPSGVKGFVINGEGAGDFSGSSISGADDVNGDGLADLIVSALGADPASGYNAGKSYLVFGKTDTTAINLSSLGTGGFIINGESASYKSGSSVSIAGDVNGDGLADLIVAASSGDAVFGADVGKFYLVFGKTDTTAINLSSLDAGGFIINGAAAGERSGSSVSGAGDVNGDGLADLIIDAPSADPASGVDAGKSYLVFGKTDTTAINLSSLGVSGFVINGEAAADFSGSSVSSAGDVNGDGLADLIVGAPNADPASGSSAGKSYLVFGKTDTTEINLSSLGSGGFIINGETIGDNSGRSVSSAGDINGDGLADLIIGAPNAGPASVVPGIYNGKSYLVFGKTDTTAINLSSLGSSGFVINGEANFGRTGSIVSSAGDVNGDGLADLIVSTSRVSRFSNRDTSYLVFGKTDTTAIDLSSLGSNGFMIYGETAYDVSNVSVSSAGDLNGDGFADLILADSSADPASGTDAGKSYVIFGGDFTGSVTQLGTDAVDNLTGTADGEALVGAAGDDILSDGGFTNILMYGGTGNDSISINNTNFRRLDGGLGNDTLLLAGTGITLDLTGTSDNTKIVSFETIDLTGTGNNTLNLTYGALLNLVEETRASGGFNRLTVRGDTGDIITANLTGFGFTSSIGATETTYTKANLQLVVENDITQTGITV